MTISVNLMTIIWSKFEPPDMCILFSHHYVYESNTSSDMIFSLLYSSLKTSQAKPFQPIPFQPIPFTVTLRSLSPSYPHNIQAFPLLVYHSICCNTINPKPIDASISFPQPCPQTATQAINSMKNFKFSLIFFLSLHPCTRHLENNTPCRNQPRDREKK